MNGEEELNLPLKFIIKKKKEEKKEQRKIKENS